MNNYLIDQDYMSGGVYRAYVIKRSDSRVFIPGLTNKNILDSNGDISNEEFERIKETLPKPLYNSEEIMKLLDDKPTPCFVAFENGNAKRPIVLAYFGKGVKSVPGSGGSESSSSSTGNNSSNTDPTIGLINQTINGVNIRKNIIFTSSNKNSCQYLVIHTSCGPGASAQSIANSVKNQGLSIHGVIDDNGVLQTAEWTTKCAHCGNGNSVSIGFEQTEHSAIKWNTKTWVPSWDNSMNTAVKVYHDKLYSNAVGLFATLAKQFNIPPENCISHKEIAGIYGGSDHSDPESLWDVFKNKFNDDKWTMTGFRNNIRETIKNLK